VDVEVDVDSTASAGEPAREGAEGNEDA